MKKVLCKSKIQSPKSKTKAQPTGRKELLASENGTIVKKWGNKIHVCVVFPNTYYIGMSNLAAHILYKTLNSYDDVVCERCFLEENGECVSIESGRPLKSFECIFFTISFEMDFINIPKILRLSSIPVYSEERKKNDPIIVAGGICVISNPEPIHSFIDLFIMGDIESTIPDFMEKFREMRGKDRKEAIDELSKFDWVYNPARLRVSYQEDGIVGSFTPEDFIVKINRYRGKTLGTSAIVAEKTEFSDMFLVEGTRGCPSKCPFCLLGNSYRFVCDKILPLKTDMEDIGIIGGGVSFHPHLVEITTALKAAGKRVHFPSLRLDEIPLSIIELMRDEIKTLTFGIEAGTERLRVVIGKPLTDQEIYDKLSAILKIKPFNLKLYFMIGLPGETMEDIEGIVELVKHVKHIMVKEGAKRGFVGSVTVHASPFVPKPSTPFQRFPMNDIDELKDKINRLKRSLAKVDNTYFTHESVKYSFVQAALARGDRRLKDIILKFADNVSLSRIMKDSAINLNFYALRERGKDEIMPWDFIKVQ
ncbi:MAG: radical SAM protein [Proteobacteria bacterium]|nr:radical SAM protein [Pseudomonadota bacterium]